MPGKKILIALSGGVDSAVSAALLKKRGFAVFGAHFRFFDPALRKGRGRSDTSLKKARLVAEKLNIPLEIVDARKEFQEKIVDYFISSYKKGITPNPCVVCNKEMKFRLLFELLKKKKADFVATGHYARVARQSLAFESKSGFSLRLIGGFLKAGLFENSSKPSFNYKLLEATDKSKDQSYFLHRLTQKELAKIVFPLGELKKTEVRKLAKKFKLPIFEEEESQDICFMQSNDLNTYLNKYLKISRGGIVDESGKILARHKGLSFYTIGQRKGIEIGGTGPYFVIGKNSRKNELIVSNDPKQLMSKNFKVNNVNWINKPQKFPSRAEVQIRYHSEKFSAIIKQEKLGRLVVETAKPLRAVTPGQSAVFFKKDEILGGGTIKS